MSIRIGNTLLAGTTIERYYNAHDILDYKWTDKILDNASWIDANLYSWLYSDPYEIAYNHLVTDIDGVTASTETVGSTTITYYQASDEHKIILSDQITAAEIIFNEMGVAWYYILDTTNQRFKLPRENPVREELIQLLRIKGNGTSLGLTDGANNLGLKLSGNVSSLGAYDVGYNKTLPDISSDGTTSSAANSIYGVTADPTKSGIIADMADSISVYDGKKHLYFYIGPFGQTALEQTAGINTGLFTRKVDLDFGNMNPSSTAKETIVGWGMPDYNAAVAITLPYTATKDGYIVRNVQANSYVHLNLGNSGIVSYAGAAGNYNTVSIPIGKGDSVSLNQSGGTWDIYFVPCKGE